MKFVKKFFKCLTLFLLFSSAFHIQNHLNGMEKGKEHAEPETQSVSILPSLQQKNFTSAGVDCGYFAIYSAIKMVEAPDENNLKTALMKKNEFESNRELWKDYISKGTTELTAEEIEKILNEKELHLPAEYIIVINQPEIINYIDTELRANRDPAESIQKAPSTMLNDQLKILIPRLNSLIKKSYENQNHSFAIIFLISVEKFHHWIPYGISTSQKAIKIYATNSYTKLLTTNEYNKQLKDWTEILNNDAKQAKQIMEQAQKDNQIFDNSLKQAITRYADILNKYITYRLNQQTQQAISTQTTSSTIVTTAQEIPELKLEKLCKDFEDIQFQEQIKQSEKTPKPKKSYFDQKFLINILNQYYEQAKKEFPGVDFENIAKENSKGNYSQTLLKKLKVKDGDTLLCMGDFHGSVHSLLRNLYNFKLNGYLDDNFKLKNNAYVICTGDYVDRGGWGTEVAAILFYLKLKNPNNIILIRGNHEEVATNMHFGFLSELMAKYEQNSQKIHEHFNEVFTILPYGLWIETPDKKWILCTHGGFDTQTFDEVKKKYLDTINNFVVKQPENLKINKYSWYDFDVQDNQVNMGDKRGSGDAITDIITYLTKNNIGAIIRGHQHRHAGFKIFPKVNNKFLSSSATQNGPLNWQDKTITPTLKAPLSLAQPAPIFTLSTATEMIEGPKRSSYTKVIIGDTIAKSTINPIETSQDLTNPKNRNHIIQVEDELKETQSSSSSAEPSKIISTTKPAPPSELPNIQKEILLPILQERDQLEKELKKLKQELNLQIIDIRSLLKNASENFTNTEKARGFLNQAFSKMQEIGIFDINDSLTKENIEKLNKKLDDMESK